MSIIIIICALFSIFTKYKWMNDLNSFLSVNKTRILQKYEIIRINGEDHMFLLFPIE